MNGMPFTQVQKVHLQDILYIRQFFLQANNCQIRYNACHERGWTDSYLITINDERAGYVSVKGKEAFADRDTIFEFYLLPPYRQHKNHIFKELIKVSGTSFIECQSNDLFLPPLLYQFANNIVADVILFEDRIATHHEMLSVIFREATKDDTYFDHKSEPNGSYVLERDGEIVASGGFLLHYNIPFADLYMEVREDCRGLGYGSFLLQEVKKQCYLAGRVPAARCNITNLASKACLLKAGLSICGYMLTGYINQ